MTTDNKTLLTQSLAHLQKSNTQLIRQTSSLEKWKNSTVATALALRYKTPISLLSAIKPTSIDRQCIEFSHLSDFVRVESPKISDLAIAFQDHDTAMFHISLYITNLNNLLNMNSKESKMNAIQIEDCTQTLYRESRIYELTVLEFHEFFNRIKAGCYGELYGSIDTVKICLGLRKYIAELISVRNAIRKDAENKQRCIDYNAACKAATPPHKPTSEWFEDQEEDAKKFVPIVSSALRRRGVL